MRGNIADDPSVAFPLEKPFGTARQVWPVRTQARCLDHAANRPGADQLPSLDGRRAFQAFAEADRVDALRLSLYATDLGKLVERSETRLVAHVVFAVAHDLNTERRAFVRDPGADDHLNRRV